MAEPRRILIGLTEVAGFYRGLHAGFQELGVPADLLVFNPHPFDYGAAPQRPAVRLMQALTRRQTATPASKPLQRAVWFTLRAAMRPFFFVRALAAYDVFIFGFGTTFLGGWDLAALRSLGKTVIFQFHGSDSRPPYLDGTVMLGPGALTIDQAAGQARKKKTSSGRSNGSRRRRSTSRRRRTFTSAPTSTGCASAFRRVRHPVPVRRTSKRPGGGWRRNPAARPCECSTRRRIRSQKDPNASGPPSTRFAAAAFGWSS